MREMKETYNEWLKEIPVHWRLSKINALYQLRNEKVSDRDYQPLSVTMKGITPQIETAAKTNAHDDRKLVRKGDFAINSRSDRRGSCGISSYDGSVSLINTVMKPYGEMDPGYYDWLFHTDQFADEFYKWGHGIVDDLWTTNWQDMKHIDIPVPPLFEQRYIANYLDNKCSLIDEISKKIQEEIDTLEEYKKSVITEAVTKGLDPNAEMKDSGVEWIGKLPTSWSISKLGNVLKLRTEKNNKPLEEVNLISLYTDKGVVQHDDLEETTGNKAQKAEGYKIVHKNDIVVNIILAWMGAMGISAYDGVTSPAYDVYEINTNKIVPHYCHYILRTPSLAGECYKYGRGIMMMRWRTYSTEFKKIKMPLPSLKEQKEIADFLDQKCSDIDLVILKKQQQLSTLDGYKKSLIYEYVTGKKEVA